MAVFSFRTIDQLNRGIQSLADRLINPSQLVLTPDEFIAAFINPDHVAALKQVGALVGSAGSQFVMPDIMSSSGARCKNYISFGYSTPPIIIPDYANEGMQLSAPEELRTKIIAWVDQRVHLGTMFGDAIDALHWLNDNCGNASAMAVMFPALPTILKEFDSDPESLSFKRAKRIVDAKSFGTLPKLPREVKQRILECSDLLLTVSMLEYDNLPSLNKSEALMKIHDVSHPVKRPDFIYAALNEKANKLGSFI
jgi:hypothetical protein